MRKTYGGAVLVTAVALALSSPVRAQSPQPGPEHEHFKQLVGTWDATVKTSFGPGESKGTMVYKLDVGGLWLVGNFKSDFGGMPFQGKGLDTYDPVTKKYVGYGSPFFNNTGCVTETGPGAGGFLPGALSNCTSDTRVLIEGTAGVWFKLFDGSKEKLNWGRIQFGPQYSYVVRNTWSGVKYPNQPQGVDNMVFTSFRYYLP